MSKTYTPPQFKNASTSNISTTPFPKSSVLLPRQRFKFGETRSQSSSSGSEISSGPPVNILDPRMQNKTNVSEKPRASKLVFSKLIGEKQKMGASNASSNDVSQMEAYVISKKKELLEEQKKMATIQRMISLKKEQNTSNWERNQTSSGHIQLALEKRKLANERKAMQRELETERIKLEVERRRIEDQRKILELEASVKKLEEMVKTSKQSSSNSTAKSIKDRLGSKVDNKVKNKMLTKFQNVSSFNSKRPANNEVIDAESYPSTSKRNREETLPEELVLTELTDEGPVPKMRHRIKAETELPEELVLTEFGENGPVCVKK